MAEILSQWFLPLVYSTGLAVTLSIERWPWQAARATALLGLVATIAVSGSKLAGWWAPSLAVDKLGLTLALLVSLLGWVIINFSHRYLQGEPNQLRFVRAMLFTLSCVAALVVSHHLLVIVLVWSGTSVGLHYLLTFYQERKTAQIVAHKKFIASRLADLFLLVALLLIFNATGTLTLGGINADIAATPSLPAALHVAAVLIALAAIVKAAQLPLHGWLIQVMEAPTPVSALLHAGVVNIGGFVLIRLAELLSVVPVAQALLVVVGSSTAVLAGLVMMTRISTKVRLAWSTCAQMGFMLMEVGLGLYELALLHLVAHSLYKAYAFLAAGDTVAETRNSAFLPTPSGQRSLWWYLFAAVQSGVIVALSFALWQWALPALKLPMAAGFILALGLAALLWFEQGASPRLVARGLSQVIALTQVYVVWHAVFAGLAPPAAPVASALSVWVMAGFSMLYVMQVWLRSHPDGRLAGLLYPWAYCGFYVDETFTRLTFRFWPVRLSPLQVRTLVNQ